MLLLAFKKQIQPDKELHKIRSDIFIKDNYYNQLMNESYSNNNIYINEEMVNRIHSNTNDSKITLIYRYSALSCNTCVEFGKQKLNEYFGNYGKNKYIKEISSGFPSTIKKNNDNIIELGKNKLGIPLEKSNIPFFCILKENQIIHVFIPESKFYVYTDIYLDNIKKRYFDDL